MDLILDEFDNKQVVLENLRNKVTDLISDLIYNSEVQVHQISSRVKSWESLFDKLERKGDKYKSLSDITDLVGIRIITFFDEDVDKIAQIIESEFKIDHDNSIDKRKVENDKFGYMSLHYVASMTLNRTKLPEYKNYKNIKFEIQIRSILQHSWAEIEHDLGYKGAISIPEVAKRNFYRIAALLETADKEFSNLKRVLEQYEQQVNTNSINSAESTIDKITLIEYIKTSKILHEVDQAIVKACYETMSDKSSYKDAQIYESLAIIHRLKINNYNTLDAILKDYKDKIVEMKISEKSNSNKFGTGKFIKGASILVLGRLLKITLANTGYDVQLPYRTAVT